MKNILFFVFLFISGAVFSQNTEINYADPTIFVENGKYYLSGTKYTGTAGFALLVSEDLKNWRIAPGATSEGNILSKGSKTYGNTGFWAPQFYKIDNTYYLTYTANEQVAVATSNKITGPFLQTDSVCVDKSAKNIDSFVFKDDNGKYYLYHVRFTGGNYIYVAEFDPVTKKIKGTPKQCLTKNQNWENSPNDGEYTGNNIMEGPTVFKKDGVYYLMYSANHFKSTDYAVGYAVATSPLGPWTKYAKNPIIHKTIVGENGSGHGDLFFDNQGKGHYVYHVHNSTTKVDPRKTRIVGLNFTYNSTLKYDEIAVDPSSVIVPVMKEILYVSPLGSGSGNGSSWANSSTLYNAATLFRTGKYAQMWLKAGTYNLPSRISLDDLYIYGGFKGDEVYLSERDWNANPTIIDGKGTMSLFRNSSGTGRAGGDARSIPCLLDGVTLQNAKNLAIENGGSLFINNGATIKNCIFRNNETQSNKHGAAIFCHSGDFVIENSLFINNTSTGNGGAIQVGDGASVTLLNCTFANNKAASFGGAIGTESTNSNVTFVNTIAYNNLYGSSDYNSYGQNSDLNGGGTITSIYSAIESASTKLNGAGNMNHIVLNRETTPGFVSPAGAIGKGTTESQINEINQSSYQLTPSSCCIDAGNDDKAKNIKYDLAKKNRVAGLHVDLGAYEFSSSSAAPHKEADKHKITVVSSGGEACIYGLQTENILNIFNMQGMLVLSEKAQLNNRLCISLPSGIYILQAEGQALIFKN